MLDIKIYKFSEQKITNNEMLYLLYEQMIFKFFLHIKTSLN